MSETVLLIEDSPTQALRMRIGLEKEGFAVTTVSQSTAAVEACRSERPDVVLSDVRMPWLDGFELCLALRTDEDLSHIPVLLTSASVDAADREKAVESGAHGLVPKGMAPGELASLLRQAISKGN